jgi:hypothetical protein
MPQGVELQVHDAHPDPAAAMGQATAARPEVVFGPYGSGPTIQAIQATSRVVWNQGGATSRLRRPELAGRPRAATPGRPLRAALLGPGPRPGNGGRSPAAHDRRPARAPRPAPPPGPAGSGRAGVLRQRPPFGCATPSRCSRLTRSGACRRRSEASTAWSAGSHPTDWGQAVRWANRELLTQLQPAAIAGPSGPTGRLR